MDIYYSSYQLVPLKRITRLSSMDPKQGVHLKGVIGDKICFADYFPHLPFGDRCCERFLAEFKLQEEEYDRKVLDLLLKDVEYQTLKPQKFFNHQLWSGTEEIKATTVKYCLQHRGDRVFMAILQKGLRLRLDLNALFTREQFEKFIADIPPEYYHLIVYFEDPISERDWSGLSIPCASDIMAGSPAQYYIYRPNCEFEPNLPSKMLRYSAYLAGELSNWHTYCELIKFGDLTATHGIIAQNYYENELPLFLGDYQSGFTINTEAVDEMYRSLHRSEWKFLCSI